MPRPLRIQASGAIYHITSRGNRRQPVFLDADDHFFHLWWMNQVAAESEWEVFGYVHMTNHFHFLVRTPKPNLSRGMQRLNGLYGQVFNIRHRQSGHVFQGRFHSELVESEGHLFECARYDDLNPVRAGLCDHPLDWQWSSCRALMGLVPKPDFLRFDLLDHFGSDIEHARQRYLAFVEDRLERAA
jgi:REP-associated tyrosine transposase